MYLTVFTEKLEDDLSYKSGVKSYRIYSFTDRNNIDLEYFYKSATHVLLPSSGIDDVCVIVLLLYLYKKILN